MAHQHCAQGEGALNPSRERGGLEARLGLDGLDVVGAVRGRLVLGLLVLHGVDDLVVRRGDRGARDGADDEDPEVAEVVRAACAELKFLGAFISIASTPTPSARHLLSMAWRGARLSHRPQF